MAPISMQVCTEWLLFLYNCVSRGRSRAMKISIQPFKWNPVTLFSFDRLTLRANHPKFGVCPAHKAPASSLRPQTFPGALILLMTHTPQQSQKEDPQGSHPVLA